MKKAKRAVILVLGMFLGGLLREAVILHRASAEYKYDGTDKEYHISPDEDEKWALRGCVIQLGEAQKGINEIAKRMVEKRKIPASRARFDMEHFEVIAYVTSETNSKREEK